MYKCKMPQNWPNLDPKWAKIGRYSFCEISHSIFAKHFSQNHLLHFAKFRETRHSNDDPWLPKNSNEGKVLPHFLKDFQQEVLRNYDPEKLDAFAKWNAKYSRS